MKTKQWVWKFLIICKKKVRKGPKKSFKATGQDFEEMSPLQKAALDKYLFIPEALASDRILLKNRTCDLKFRGGVNGNKEGMGSAAIFIHVYLMN